MTTSLPDQSKNETKKIVSTDQAPAAIGPYSQAVIYGGLVYCSGQIALDPVTMEIVGEDAETQAKQVMNNLGEVLSAAGSDFSKVIKCSIFLDSMDDFGVVNEVYGAFFTENPPARETVAVQTLPKNVLVEISCIASV
ncbi:RidA family protein [Balneolaceae bacterium]|mgnify:FL=1|jgi:2-iminobutanoate/2-iminopropanoate deaminase|nr:RidA family protein [Balneolaceae bacterium]MDA0737159.1 RidA family protein [Bacteroidota bacterium]MDC0592416.1 RidA family protein [Balneolaceae bacterium]CAI8371449.1 MAG: 2-iminobutanoate/2-iminopropanoate deaminase [Rhodothermaeota bacterium MED-G12]|tara:strand:- start:3848 stop:4261 length:414 start_codon:yes stop_codon:yes gene_type:complete